MATIVPPKEGSSAEEKPRLYDGQRLSQPDYHRLYNACPDDQKYELIEGVVHMAAAYRGPHTRFSHHLGGLIWLYEQSTPGIRGYPGATTILDDENEPEPDLQLRILREFGGRGGLTKDQYVTGPPELVIEISHSTLHFDLTKKLTMYRDQGIKEYLVVCVDSEQIRWFVWPQGEQQIDSDGILKSVAFPGLWINSQALFAERIDELRATLSTGLHHRDHAAFVTALQHNAQENKTS